MAGFKYWRRDGSGTQPLGYLQLDTSVTVAVGDAVKREADGYGNIATTTNAIYGIAEEAVTGATGTRPTIPVTLAHPDVLFAIEASGTTSQAVIGTSVPFEGATGAQKVDEDGSATGANLVIENIKPGETHGSGAELLVRVIKSQVASARS